MNSDNSNDSEDVKLCRVPTMQMDSYLGLHQYNLGCESNCHELSNPAISNSLLRFRRNALVCTKGLQVVLITFGFDQIDEYVWGTNFGNNWAPI
ncbi:hypothetical protein OUZ56_011805 [Daphnia magna]|uniref:Uncharacterized protein n=1 Tax=Daphnia magna TaxID=35525 RepID=A0ABQ9Z168_9CRUS|nr:hypothetical protein OUZ56_011805 [Daphnia magna]